jgi:hypothetical protein
MNRIIVPLFASVSLLIVSAYAIADDDPAPATAPAASAISNGAVSGTVLKDGKPLEGMQVRLILPARQQPTTAPSSNASTPASARGRRQIVAEATTDAHGKFTLSDVPPGSYRVVAGKHGQGARAMRISVAAGQTAEVTLTGNPANADKIRHHKKKLGK